MEYKLILASSSQTRKKFFDLCEVPFEVIPSNLDESKFASDDVFKLVETLAQKKAKVVAEPLTNVQIIGVDTVISFENHILGKPRNKMQAVEFLKKLSNQQHSIVNGWAVIKKTNYIVKSSSGVAETKIRFRRLSKHDIEQYCNDYDVTQWAAGYNPFSRAIGFITAIEGSFGGLYGLPLEHILAQITD
jgi:septum formation protein